MEKSGYNVVLIGESTPASNDYISHYGVKGMKWGVVKEDDRNQNRSSATDVLQDKQLVEKIRDAVENLPPDTRQALFDSTQRFLQSDEGKELQSKINSITENSSGDLDLEDIQEIAGAAVDMVKSEEFRDAIIDMATSEEFMDAAGELIDVVKDVALDELENVNPTLGKAAKTVDSFLDELKDVSINFATNWKRGTDAIGRGFSKLGKKLFGKENGSSQQTVQKIEPKISRSWSGLKFQKRQVGGR